MNANIEKSRDYSLSSQREEPTHKKAKLIAIYFPQFHEISENNSWWGNGFTDWNNVRSAVPQFESHYQPRSPLHNNYYNQSQITTLKWQVDVAKKHGIYGFCHYHYWFDGKQLLEKPTDIFLENKDIDFPFCLSWANETWSRRWDGNDHQVLMQQTHPPTHKSWKRHYDYLIKAWNDPRAIKVDGKPVFVIYRPHFIENIDEMLSFWRDLAKNDGLPGLYFIFQKQYELPNNSHLKSFDAIFQFQPFEAVYSPNFSKKNIQQSLLYKFIRGIPEHHLDMLRGLKSKFTKKLKFHDYEITWKHIVEIRPDRKLTTFPGAFVDWDNSSRYKNRATIFRGASPEKFAKWFNRLVETLPQRNLPEDFIFLNAWNEWSEGAYLEPDEKYGYQYLEAVRKIIFSNYDKTKPVDTHQFKPKE